MRIVVAPDKFKGTLSAIEVAECMSRAGRAWRPDASIEVAPLSDGGDGFIASLTSQRAAEVERRRVRGPLGDPVDAPVAHFEDGTIAIEMASASGLALLPAGTRDALHASSFGTGELIAAALSAAPAAMRVVVGLGGSATTDGGTGAATAIGWRFLDAGGRELPGGGGHLLRLRSIAAPRRIVGHDHVMVGACDVAGPLLGPHGAARGFATQKGASVDDVELLEEALGVLAERIRAELGVDVSDLPGAGAAGGMGAGLVAFFGATLTPGLDLVARALLLPERIDEAGIVLTGEGRLDAESLHGKVVGGVARMCRAAGVTCLAIAGEVTVGDEELEAAGISGAAALVDAVGARRATASPAAAIQQVTDRLLRDVLGA